MDDELGESRAEGPVGERKFFGGRQTDVDLGVARSCRLDERLRRVDRGDRFGAGP